MNEVRMESLRRHEVDHFKRKCGVRKYDEFPQNFPASRRELEPNYSQTSHLPDHPRIWRSYLQSLNFTFGDGLTAAGNLQPILVVDNRSQPIWVNLHGDRQEKDEESRRIFDRFMLIYCPAFPNRDRNCRVRDVLTLRKCGRAPIVLVVRRLGWLLFLQYKC